MKVIFEIDTEKENADEYLKLINEKDKVYVGVNELCELYRRIYNRKIYDNDIIKKETIQDPRHKDDPTRTLIQEWISLDYIENELEKIFEDLKDFQYWE